MARKAAQVVIDCLMEHGVDTVFGYPGGAILPVYDALYDSPLRHILVRHEQGAAHAADAYARVTGRVGVCMATSGPGATNLVTGLTNAYMDSIPVLAITGQVPTEAIGRDAFQEADITGITLPVTKHNYLVRDARELPRVLSEAIYVAATGRPGPVLVDLPKDVLNWAGEFEPCPARPRLRGCRPHRAPDERAVQEAARALNRARRPLLFVGGGAIHAGASELVHRLAETAQLPVISTLMGLGVFPGTHPQFLGMVGMHGTFPANRATSHADLILALGVRFDDRVTGALHKFAPRAQIVHVDIDAAELGKNVQPHIAIAADVRRTLEVLLPLVKERDLAEWWEEIEGWCRKHPIPFPCRAGREGVAGAQKGSCHPASLQLLRGAGAGLPGGPVPQSTKGPLQPHHLIWEVYRVTEGRAVVVTDVGQHQMWTALFYPIDSPRQFVTSGGLGTMGFGLPAAIGAQVGRPGDEVWLITGDGSLLMTCQELATAVSYRLPIRVVIVNNGYLGMVRQWQQLFYQRRYSQVDLAGTPDFVRLAEAFGARGLRAETPAELGRALEEMRRTPGPAVLDAVVEREANVFPMIPSGMSVDDIIVTPAAEEEKPAVAVARR